MIKNGNYQFFDVSKHLDKFVGAFAEFYRTDDISVREIIEQRFNHVRFVPFYSFNFVVDYYNKMQQEIVDKNNVVILKSLQIPNKRKNREALFGFNKHYQVHNISLAMDGGFDLKNIDYTDEHKDAIKSARNNLYKALSFKGDENEKYDKLMELSDKFALTLDVLTPDCDVKRDVEVFLNTQNIYTKRYILDAMNEGYKLSDEDVEKLSRPNIPMNILKDLDCASDLFGIDIFEQGILSAFSSEASEILKSGDKFEKTDIMLAQLGYMINHGVEIDGLTEEDFLRDDYGDDFCERIAYIHKYCAKTLKDFLPSEQMVEAIEYRRLINSQLHVRNKLSHKHFGPNVVDVMTLNELLSEEYGHLAIRFFEDNNVYQEQVAVYFDLDENVSPEMMLELLIHEYNHILSFGQINNSGEHKNNIVSTKLKNGLLGLKSKFDKTEGNLFEPLDYSARLRMVEENFNQQQTKEILEIFNKNYENPFQVSDLVVYENKPKICSAYNEYDFLLNDLYKHFYSDLKRNNIDKNFIFSERTTPFERIKDYVQEKLGMNCGELKGAVRYKDLQKFENLIDFYNKEKSQFVIKMQDGVISENVEKEKDANIALSGVKQGDKYEMVVAEDSGESAENASESGENIVYVSNDGEFVFEGPVIDYILSKRDSLLERMTGESAEGREAL